MAAHGGGVGADVYQIKRKRIDQGRFNMDGLRSSERIQDVIARTAIRPGVDVPTQDAAERRHFSRKDKWMLVLTRKASESIRIGGEIEIRVVRCKSGRVVLGIEAPVGTKILRGELPEEEKRAA